MNTVMELTAYGDSGQQVLDQATERIYQLEHLLSVTDKNSDISAINHGEGAWVPVSQETFQLLSLALSYGRETQGALDITAYSAVHAWGFTTGEYRVPGPEELAELAARIDYTQVELDPEGCRVRLPQGMQLDLGSIAKGYIADRMKEQILEAGAKSAIINLGGNVLCVGSLPDGAPFRIGLQMPFADYEETFETLGISDLSVVTSGIYERSFTVDGTLYHHILNPKTGYPYDNGLIAVTILSGESVDGDGLSTTCFSLGLEEGLKLAESLEGVEACFIDSDYRVHYTSGMKSYLLSQDTRLPEARE